MNLYSSLFQIIESVLIYFFSVSFFYLMFYVFFKKQFFIKKIQIKYPKFKDYKRDFIYSAISIVILATPVAILLGNENFRSHTTFYSDINVHGKLYLVGALFLMLIMHDTYFYWMHRLIHHPKLFKTIHLVHHKSTNPSPWTSYAFNPIEAFLESLIFVIFLFTIPIHPILIFSFFIISLVITISGHHGFEFLPQGWTKHWFSKWINTSVTHNQHHTDFNKNYGLYFTFWDRMMGTLSTDYDSAFLKVKSRKKAEITDDNVF